MPVLALFAASVLAFAGVRQVQPPPAGDGRVEVVASTSVYGQIAEEIGGDAVDVTSLVRSPSQDPHSFEPSARDQLAVKHADLLIRNGGGYDDFMDALIEASGSTAPILTAVEFSSHGPAVLSRLGRRRPDEHFEGFNEHVWYDLAAMTALAHGIEARLAALNPNGATRSPRTSTDSSSGSRISSRRSPNQRRVTPGTRSS